ncbi:MAG: hypothetical protein ACI8ZM_002061 [Crocinitomix sp.]
MLRRGRITPKKLTIFRMIYRAILLVSALLFMGGNAGSQETITTDDYSFQIPQDWNSFSSEYLESLEIKNRDSFESKGFEYPRSYIIGYCENDSLIQEPPFIIGIYNSHNNNIVSFDSIVAANRHAWMGFDVKSEPIKDLGKNRFYLEIEIDNVYLFTGYIPGANGTLCLILYSELHQVNQRRNQFLQIYQSVQFNLPYVYHNVKEEVDKEMKRTGYFLGIATLLFIIVSVGRYFVKKSKQDDPEVT